MIWSRHRGFACLVLDARPFVHVVSCLVFLALDKPVTETSMPSCHLTVRQGQDLDLGPAAEEGLSVLLVDSGPLPVLPGLFSLT